MTHALQSLYSSQPDETEAEKRCGLRLELSTCRVLDEVTSDGRLFQVFAAATGKARLPIIQRRVGGTTSAEVEDDRSRCRPGI